MKRRDAKETKRTARKMIMRVNRRMKDEEKGIRLKGLKVHVFIQVLSL
jgi:hypothetical protein